jgi:hypothetical protein
MKRPLLLLGAGAATLFAATTAEASRVSWSIGVNVPPVATYVSSGPAWVPAPVRYASPAVVYAPAPVVYDDPYVESYVVPSAGFYAAPVVMRPPHRYWGPPHHGYWAPAPRPAWGHHDRWHHEGEFRR